MTWVREYGNTASFGLRLAVPLKSIIPCHSCEEKPVILLVEINIAKRYLVLD